jgi:4-amino-4-deoxy-L-arabinose transferase-like glycosyltransferase
MQPTESTVSAGRSPALSGACLLAAIYLVTVGWNLWQQPVENPDEPNYAAPARDMADGHTDWLVPVFNDQPRTVKPILVYWCLAGAARAGRLVGMDMVTSFRLVPLLAGLLAVLSVYGLGRRLYNHRTGLLAALLLITTQYFHETMRELITDPLLTGFLAFSWYCFVCVLHSLERKADGTPLVPLAGFYLALGLAAMSKGPVLVAVFAVVPMTAYLIWQRRRYMHDGGWGRLLGRSGVAWGVPLALLLGFLWFILLWAEGYGDAVKRFFIEQNFQRAAGGVDKNTGLRAWPFISYFGYLAGHFVPWILLLVPALIWAFTNRRRERGAAGKPVVRAAGPLLFCAVVVPFVLMGLAASKRALYLLPLYPLLAIWLGGVWERLYLADEGLANGWTKAWSICLGIVAFAGPLAVGALALSGPLGVQAKGRFMLVPVEVAIAGIVALALLVAAVFAVQELRSGRRARASLQVLLLVAAVGLAYEGILNPALWRRENQPAFYGQIASVSGERPLIWLGGTADAAVWYLRRPVQRLLLLKQIPAGFLEKRDAVMVVRDKEWRRLPALREAVRELRALSLGDTVYHLVERDPARPFDPAAFGVPSR